MQSFLINTAYCHGCSHHFILLITSCKCCFYLDLCLTGSNQILPSLQCNNLVCIIIKQYWGGGPALSLKIFPAAWAVHQEQPENSFPPPLPRPSPPCISLGANKSTKTPAVRCRGTTYSSRVTAQLHWFPLRSMGFKLQPISSGYDSITPAWATHMHKVVSAEMCTYSCWKREPGGVQVSLSVYSCHVCCALSATATGSFTDRRVFTDVGIHHVVMKKKNIYRAVIWATNGSICCSKLVIHYF